MISTEMRSLKRQPMRSATHEVPAVDPVFETYEEWAGGALTSYDVEFNHGRSQRSVYRMLGQTVFLETHIPWSVYQPITVSMMAVDFNVMADHPIIKLAEKHGGKWMEGYYAEDGYGWPVFYEHGDEDDCARRCWEFLQELATGEWKRTQG